MKRLDGITPWTLPTAQRAIHRCAVFFDKYEGLEYNLTALATFNLQASHTVGVCDSSPTASLAQL